MHLLAISRFHLYHEKLFLRSVEIPSQYHRNSLPRKFIYIQCFFSFVTFFKFVGTAFIVINLLSIRSLTLIYIENVQNISPTRYLFSSYSFHIHFYDTICSDCLRLQCHIKILNYPLYVHSSVFKVSELIAPRVHNFSTERCSIFVFPTDDAVLIHTPSFSLAVVVGAIVFTTKRIQTILFLRTT